MVRLFLVLLLSIPGVIMAQQDKPVVAENFGDLEYLFTQETDSILVINFWATWCGPCVAELPYFSEAAKELKDNKVKFVFVSLDFKNQFESRLLPFLGENELAGEKFVLWDMDYNAWIDKVDPEWSGAIPFTLIRSAEGNIGTEASFKSAEELISLIKSVKS